MTSSQSLRCFLVFHPCIPLCHPGLYCLVPPLEVQKPSTKFGNPKSSNLRLWAVYWNCCIHMMLFASYEVLSPYPRYCTSYVHLPAFFPLSSPTLTMYRDAFRNQSATFVLVTRVGCRLPFPSTLGGWG